MPVLEEYCQEIGLEHNKAYLTDCGLGVQVGSKREIITTNWFGIPSEQDYVQPAIFQRLKQCYQWPYRYHMIISIR